MKLLFLLYFVGLVFGLNRGKFFSQLSYPKVFRSCPKALPIQGGLCCSPLGRLQKAPVDQTFINTLNSVLPKGKVTRTAAQLAFRNAFLNPLLDPNIMITGDNGMVEVTLLMDTGSFRNQLGYFLMDSKNKILPNGKFEIFPDTSFSDNKRKGLNNYCHEIGDTVTIGPFPKGTKIGFYIHANGASYVFDGCKKGKVVSAINSCLNAKKSKKDVDSSKSKGDLNDMLDCFALDDDCNYDPNKESTPGFNYYYTVDALNIDYTRHVGVINDSTTDSVIIGFEDATGTKSDWDYKDVVFRVKTTNGNIPNLPKTCKDNCSLANGFCNVQTGQCQCNSQNLSLYNSDCTCAAGVSCTPNCKNGGECICDKNTCSCPLGFSGDQCQCLNDFGTCYGNGASWSCDRCTCPAGFTTANSSFNAGAYYQVQFGPSNTALLADAVLDRGSVFADNGIGSYGWNQVQTVTQLIPGGSGTLAASNIVMSGEWSIKLLPNKSYDVTVVVGGDSIQSFNTIVLQGSTVLVDNVASDANVSATYTGRVTVGADGILKISSRGLPTRLAAVTITRPPCTCANCPSCVNGKCDCDTGRCVCAAGFEGTLCDCVAGRSSCINGSYNCATGVCTCQPGFRGQNCDKRTCPSECSGNGTCQDSGICLCNSGFSGVSCACKTPLGVCVQGTGYNCSTGACICKPGFIGDLCECVATCPANCSGNGTCKCDGTCQCNSDYLGASDCSCKTPIGICANGTADCQTGLCNCATGWAGPLCQQKVCPQGFYGPDCEFQSCSQSCKNGSSCDVDGNCVCLSSFTGTFCECTTCSQACTNAAGFKSCNCDGSCSCKDGFHGSDCDRKYCASSCQNGGTCGNDGQCQCNAGFSGSDCSCKICTKSCSSPGSIGCDCSDTCLCKEGYFGTLCENKECASECKNGGTCLANGTCQCVNGFSGKDCSEIQCPKPCIHGSCDLSTGWCVCDSGWNLLNDECNCLATSCLNDCSSNGECLCGSCQCSSGFGGPDCSCSTLGCVDKNNCSGNGSCSCNQCICNTGFEGADCSCKSCPKFHGLVCNGHGNCNCDGTCSCETGYYGNSCQHKCVYDACGVCDGDGYSCAGCDHVPNSGKVLDSCLQCGGNNTLCAGCDGIPNSGKVFDRCNVCGGDGTSCSAEVRCNLRTNCNDCNSGSNRNQFCIWCSSSNTCHDINNTKIVCDVFEKTCPIKSNTVPINSEYVNNENSSSVFAIASGIGGAFVLGGAIAGSLFVTQRKRAALLFDTTQWNNTSVANPLYQDRTLRFENPMYQDPSLVNEEED